AAHVKESLVKRSKRKLIAPAEKLNFSEKVCRLGHRMKDSEWRRYFGLLVAGEVLGLAMLAIVVLVGPEALNMFSAALAGAPVFAQPTHPAPAAPPTPPAAAVAAAPTTAPAATPVMSTDMTDLTKNPVINPLNTVWTLVAAFLVFGMQAGFTMLEAGFC